ncbi:hypothetical protein LSH36_45g00016 [Paralvinella palmiformis]|uniref:Peptidase S1 domain-containing protein n=1 Tax=Paralvinella palmiformis TaxID=53620 RepID=A0AAD9NEL2_9ANNE|nr:hypothetical protein LSH36_45g00016 [Paralvinella palmiformis]
MLTPSLGLKLGTYGSSDSTSTRLNALQFAWMTVKTREFCSMFGESFDTNICLSDDVGDHERSPCFGDSGGPMVLKKEDGRFTVIGIASFVAELGCAEGVFQEKWEHDGDDDDDDDVWSKCSFSYDQGC